MKIWFHIGHGQILSINDHPALEWHCHSGEDECLQHLYFYLHFVSSRSRDGSGNNSFSEKLSPRKKRAKRATTAHLGSHIYLKTGFPGEPFKKKVENNSVPIVGRVILASMESKNRALRELL